MRCVVEVASLVMVKWQCIRTPTRVGKWAIVSWSKAVSLPQPQRMIGMEAALVLVRLRVSYRSIVLTESERIAVLRIISRDLTTLKQRILTILGRNPLLSVIAVR
jgi:hypothetical protein